MSHSTISSESPFEALASLVVSDSDSVEPSFNLEPFSDRVSPATDPDDELLGLSDTADYYGGSEFSKDDPSKDGPIDASSSTNESLPAQAAPAFAPKWPYSSPSSSVAPPPTTCRVLPTPALPAAAKLAVMAQALHFVPIELLPPRKRLVAMERVEALKREVASLRYRLAAAEIQIDALQGDNIGRDVREVRIKARLKRVEDAMHRR
ncbi:hypothetical protein Tco_0323606 [Tanacetum coccineum]